jgi:folate-binding protein YgfZ
VPQADHEVATTPGAIAIRLPVDRYEVLLSTDHAPAALARLKGATEPRVPAYWEWLDLQAGVPTITEPTREAFVPQMANLDLIGGLSFSKGCYPGQEIVARMHYLGRLKQRMYLAHVTTDAPPQPGDKLYSTDLGTQASGTVVNAAPSPTGGYDLLAVMQIESADQQAMHWKTPDGPVLEMLELPYEVTRGA